MCNTPTYCDLGKAAKDVFNKGYGKYAMVNFQVWVRVSGDGKYAMVNFQVWVRVSGDGLLCVRYHASEVRVSQH
jgi:hypothetical protein